MATSTKFSGTDPVLIREGDYVDALLFFPTIESFTISRGWNNDRIAKLPSAVKTVIEANPILTSRASISKGAIYAHPGTFLLNEHDFVDVIDVSDKVPSTLTFDEEHYHENIGFITNIIAPLVKKHGKTGGDEIKKNSPLFSVTLFVLDETHVCYRVAMSHLLGDGTTYYLLMEQLSLALNGEEFEPINWGNPALIPHRMYPESCSKRDIFRFSGLPFMIGVISGFPSMPFRKKSTIIFNTDAINVKKRDMLQKEKHEFLSSNDIIMTALCKLTKPASLMSMLINKRTKDLNTESRDGGLCIKMAYFDKEAGLDPNGIRQIVKDGNFYKSNEIPLIPFLRGKLSFATSWATVTKYLEGDDLHTICHTPGPAFFESPVDGAIIFKINNNCTAFSCNYPINPLQIKGDPFLKDIILENDSKSSIDTKAGSSTGLAQFLSGRKRSLVLGLALVGSSLLLFDRRKEFSGKLKL